MTPSKFAVTYPVAIFASVLAVCFTAILVVALIKGQPIQTVLGAVGTLATVLGGLYAHSRVTPVAQPDVPKGDGS